MASAALAGATGRPCLLIDSRAAGATPREWAPGDIFRIVLTARSTFADCAPLLSGADEILFVPHDLANIDVRLYLALARFATGQKQPVAQGQENDLYDAIEPFLDTAPLPLLISDAETGKPILVNRAATKLLGFTSESLEARGIESLQVNPAMRAAMFAELDRTGKVEAFPTIVCRSEGTRASVLVNLVRNQWKGRPALFGSLLDVTELKRASDRNTALIAALPDQVFEFTEEGVFERTTTSRRI